MPNKEANIPSPKLSRQTEGVCKEVKQGASKSSANTSHRSVQAIEGAGDSPKSSEATSNKQERGNSNQRNVSMTRNARRQLFDGESCGREDYQCESQVSRLKSKDLEGGPVLLNVDGCLTGYKTEDKKESEHRDNDNDNHDKEMVHRAPTKIRKTTAISFQLDTHTLHEDLVLTEDHKTIERRSSKPKTLQVTPKKVDKEGANIPKIPTTGRFISWSPTVLGDVAMTTGEYYWEVYGTRVSYTGQLDNDLCSFGVTVGDCPRNALLCFHPLGWCFHVYKTGFEGHHNRINQSMCTKFVGDGHDGDSAIHVGVLLSFSNNTLSFYNLQDSNAPSRLRLFENMCSGPLYPAFTVTSLNYQLTVINGLKLPKVLRQQIRQENEERAKRLKETKKPREVKS
ncbi:fibronectin type III and SPRY domain-containing protein 1-like [Ptychodera flava]|uniref:fibronectin type III and SPRY domain-containing protein 1-like n=1 Tax=Ptychodera flava TaxID=63121 RepID=UPI00396A414E